MFSHLKFQNEDIAIWQFVYKVVLVTRVYSDSWRNIHKKNFVSSSKNALEKKKKKKTKRKAIAEFLRYAQMQYCKFQSSLCVTRKQKKRQEVGGNLSVCLLKLKIVYSTTISLSAIIYYLLLAWKMLKK